MAQRNVDAGGFESLEVHRGSSTPVYVQIAEGMGTLLRSGVYPPGYALPPERVLCQAYGVSRMTLRQATSILESEGLIESQRGRGTFVANRRLRKQQQEMRSFTEEILERGSVPRTRILSFRKLPAGREAREFFSLPAGEDVYEICRLRMKDAAPLAIETVQIPCRLCPSLERHDLERESLYRVLEDSFRLTLDSCVEEISARIATARERRLLDVPGRGAVLAVKRVSYTDSGQAFEMTRSVFRSDLYSALVHSVRRKKPAARQNPPARSLDGSAPGLDS